jgi:opacity protein-like surface antigen
MLAVMKRLLATGIAVIALAAPAQAAKSATKEPAKPVAQAVVAAPAPAFSWTGCYVGGHLGGGWGHKNFSDPAGFELSNGSPAFTPPPPLYPGTSTVSLPLDQQVSGFLGGAQVGCKYQFASKWVVGIDGAFSKARLIGTTAWNLTPFGTAPPIIVPATFQAEVDWLASTTATLGYSFDRLLFYAKGGVAWVHDNYHFLIIPPDLSFAGPPLSLVGAADFRESEIRTGWTAGIGLEYAFSKNLSARIEYDYYDFGSKNVVFTNQFPTGASPFGTATIKQTLQTITFGLNYYFWNPAPAPVTAAPLITKAPMVTATAGPPPTDNAANAFAWSQTFASEVRYDSWRSNRPFPAGATLPGGNALLPSSGSGSELYIPYATQLTGQNNDWKIELLGRGGWVEARQTTTGLNGYVQTATDTVASATFTYLGMQGLQPFAAVEMNLPTGLASLPANAVAAQMDPDLVEVSTFGEGFNIGPTLGVNLPITNSLLLTLSAGYTHRGTFVRQSTITPPTPPAPTAVPAKIDPGDALTGTVSVGYQVGQLTTKLTGTISQQTSTTDVNDIPFLRAGRTYLAAGTWTYAWPGENIGVTTLSASASHSNRNKVMFQCLAGFGCPTTLVTEPFNSNSNLYRVGLEHLFPVGQFAYGPTGSFLFRDTNGYVPTTLQFVPAKQRWSAGAQAKYAPSNTLLFTARVERVWIHANEFPALPNATTFSVLADTPVPSFTVPVVSGNGWQFAVGATASF